MAISSSGVKPDPKKIEGIRNASPTQNASDIKSLLGMTWYVSRFIPNYATITAPLRLPTRQDLGSRNVPTVYFEIATVSNICRKDIK